MGAWSVTGVLALAPHATSIDWPATPTKIDSVEDAKDLFTCFQKVMSLTMSSMIHSKVRFLKADGVEELLSTGTILTHMITDSIQILYVKILQYMDPDSFEAEIEWAFDFEEFQKCMAEFGHAINVWKGMVDMSDSSIPLIRQMNTHDQPVFYQVRIPFVTKILFFDDAAISLHNLRYFRIFIEKMESIFQVLKILEVEIMLERTFRPERQISA